MKRRAALSAERETARHAPHEKSVAARRMQSGGWPAAAAQQAANAGITQ